MVSSDPDNPGLGNVYTIQPDRQIFLKEMSYTLHGFYQPALLPQSING
jgi:hypothetical protein